MAFAIELFYQDCTSVLITSICLKYLFSHRRYLERRQGLQLGLEFRNCLGLGCPLAGASFFSIFSKEIEFDGSVSFRGWERRSRSSNRIDQEEGREELEEEEEEEDSVLMLSAFSYKVKVIISNCPLFSYMHGQHLRLVINSIIEDEDDVDLRIFEICPCTDLPPHSYITWRMQSTCLGGSNTSPTSKN
ncbi:hypothetical protein CRG98_010141 [Punica granatum]|uniref:Uncharacterized protein n=1 Tax=Punica granatum TaxID=22663 RepID=A0A2I0KMB4_PUNGR|nr:hypothetical protein CRG98_010141 [Punica granatum]